MKLRIAVLALSLAFATCACQSSPEPFAAGTFKNWAETPPMGWNSWDCYGPTVTEDEVKANADFMADNLKQLGWEYIVVDIRWFVENDKAGGYNQTDPVMVMDKWGRYTPAVNRFPSAADGAGFGPLAEYIHSKGLKFGIHIMRGVPVKAVEEKLPVKGAKSITADMICSQEGQCAWLKDNYTVNPESAGSQEYYNSIFELYASWGVDFVKVDDITRPYHKEEIEMIRKAIDVCGRPMILSLSPGETPVEQAAHVKENANMWRMVDDVWDKWEDVAHLLDVCPKWYRHAGDGGWPDCDMIPLGKISIRGERGQERMSRLTEDEQLSLMTLFTISRSPLMFGGDLPSNDAFTMSLLTNKEVLDMHRNSSKVRELFRENGFVAVTSIDKGSKEPYLAIFNTSDERKEVSVPFSMLDMTETVTHTLHLLWTGEDVVTVAGQERFSFTLNPHESVLVRIR